MADERAQGKLPEAENERIFRSEILPDYLPAGMGSSDRRTLIAVASQPGAGATGVATASHSELEQFGPTIRIVSDDMRAYHPDFHAFQRRDADAAWDLTGLDADLWSAKLLAAAAERGINIVYESTPRAAEDVMTVIGNGRDAGYRVEVRAIAVNARLSWQGSQSRFEELHLAESPAPRPSRITHDEAVVAVAASLERVERYQAADAVSVQLRDGSVVYSNSLVRGEWQSPPGAAAALAQARERARPLTRDEIARFAETWSRVLARMEARGARADQIDDVRTQSRQDLAYLIAERQSGERTDSDTIQRSITQRGPGEPELAEAISSRLDTPQARATQMRGHGIGPASDPRRAESHRPAEAGEVIVPGGALSALTNAEIGDRLDRSQRLADKRAEIERLSVLVYGHAGAVAASMRGIDGASSGADAADDIRSGKHGPLAGEGKGFLRPESPQRQAARAHLPQLAAAMEDYGRAVAFERDRIETHHADEQRRQRLEVRAPSPGLASVLNLPHHEQASRLNATPDLRHELDRLSASINRRLSVEERTAVKVGDVNSLSRSLAIPKERAAVLTHLHSQVQAAQQHALGQRQQLARTQDARAIKR